LTTVLLVHAETWTFDLKTQQAYDLVLALKINEALELIGEPRTAQETYVVSLGQALELILTEDAEKYEDYYAQYEGRLEKRSKSSLQDDLFLQAEIRLQWAFVHIKFGHEIDAAWNLRQAYLNMQDCRNKFPSFTPIHKTSGVLEILIGSVPEKYNWVLGLMGMQGSISKGLDDIESLRTDGVFKREADLLNAIIQGYVLQNTTKAVEEITVIQSQNPENSLINFIAASLLIKNAQSEDALKTLLKMEGISNSLPLTFAYYLKGEVYLHKAEYLNAITSFRWFINNYKGQNCIKDAWYKVGLCYWLNGNGNDALEIFKQAKTMGKEDAEADKYAARCLAENELPNVLLSKVRYYTDGGFLDLAQQGLDSIRPSDLLTKRDQVEYFYRQARLSHKKANMHEARNAYLETIRLSGNEPWYFAPNACLQLGYLAWADGDLVNARSYFQQARAYPRHEYKNSIDSKAKTALSQLSGNSVER
jgi:tetratricopeptide (TPR) repeat protein